MPDYVASGVNALVIADVSGSMKGRPMATSVGLAIYFAEHNTGAYHNLFMEFSEKSFCHELCGETLQQRIEDIMSREWGESTNLEHAFDYVLMIANYDHVPQEEMPRTLIVISDMEIDDCGDRDWSFYEAMAAKYAAHGYVIPNVIFWNVESRHDVFHADCTRRGVQLVSGQSVATFRQVIETIGLTPIEAMEHVINAPRYQAITVA